MYMPVSGIYMPVGVEDIGRNPVIYTRIYKHLNSDYLTSVANCFSHQFTKILIRSDEMG